MNDRVKHRFKKLKTAYKYALLFSDSNDMLDYVCNMNTQSIINSKLYTRNGAYQLIVTTCKNCDKNFKHIFFKDKFHIKEINRSCQLVCDKNAVSKIQKAFKAP